MSLNPKLVAVTMLLVVVGCGSWGRRHRRHHSRAREGGVAASVPAIVRSAMAVVANGVTREDGTAVAIGDHLGPGAWLDVAPDGGLTLDFSIDTRVEVDGGSRVQIGAARASEILVARGGVRGLLEPVPNSQRAPLHVGAPHVGLELGADGDVYVALLQDTSAEIYVLGGLAQVRTGDVDGTGRPVTQIVPAGSEANGGAVSEGVATIDAARERTRIERESDRPGASPDVPAEVARLDAALDGHAALDAQRVRLLAVTPAVGSDAARQRVAALVQSGQQLLWRRAALLAAWESALATSGAAPPADRAPVLARADRVMAAVGTTD